jgi:hypothetical protein
VLDTGASETIIYYPALERFPFRRGELGLSQLAGGYVILTVKVKFYKVESGPFVQKYMPITVIDSVNPDSLIDGLLGMDFLMKHKYDIDFEDGLITWKD